MIISIIYFCLLLLIMACTLITTLEDMMTAVTERDHFRMGVKIAVVLVWLFITIYSFSLIIR